MRGFLALLALVASSPAFAQVAPVTPADPAASQLATDLLASLKDGSAVGDMTRFFAKTESVNSNASQVALLEGQTDAGLKLYGPVRDWALLDSVSYGRFAIQERYIVQHDKMLTIWTFDFARLPSGLVPVAVVWNDQFNTVAGDMRSSAR
jgi:hypothetical protein